MGVKSTVSLTYEEAIRLAVDFEMERRRKNVEIYFRGMNVKQLEIRLEQMNDDARGGEGFDNYLITDRS